MKRAPHLDCKTVDAPSQIFGKAFSIRAFVSSDAPALAQLYRRSVRELGGRRYSDQQVAAWANLAPTAHALIVRYKTRRCFVADEDGTGPIAFGDIDHEGLIGYFYCQPSRTGTGVSDRLYDCLEALASCHGIAVLRVEASEIARGFFERKGFLWKRRQEVKIGNVGIHNHLMEKAL